MNVVALLADLQAQHDESVVRADELRDPDAHFTAALIETEVRLEDMATTRKVIIERVPPGTEPVANTDYRASVNAFDQHPDQVFRARELHELLGTPAGEATANITRSRLGLLTRPGRGRYQKPS
ncbi:hypothetical protein OG909_21360 [Streptomyces sp. NBC_01754]|uniref:hypothetical protein n=1 Tax=Streptomyces sp. NBC_01754 TaxID=2975930 RepID=UPI002DD97BB9|nr:hypothetical protein [Streptomyces sp. NBC_01754]WSC94615.1 hypothetical protein OG909_21360 [Streptomyces sp. NBC_01754]